MKIRDCLVLREHRHTIVAGVMRHPERHHGIRVQGTDVSFEPIGVDFVSRQSPASQNICVQDGSLNLDRKNKVQSSF